MKKILLTIMLIVGLTSNVMATESSPNYAKPILIGGAIVVVGFLTGGASYLVLGASLATATTVGSTVIIGGTTYVSMD